MCVITGTGVATATESRTAKVKYFIMLLKDRWHEVDLSNNELVLWSWWHDMWYLLIHASMYSCICYLRR